MDSFWHFNGRPNYPKMPHHNMKFTGKMQGAIKTTLGVSGIALGVLTWPEGAPVAALSIPILAEGATLLFIEYGLEGDVTDVPFTIIDPFFEISIKPCP